MKQKLLYSFKLRATLLVALLCAVCTGAWADDYSAMYNYSALTDMLEGSYEDASSYWKVPSSAGKSATIAVPITNQPNSDITITFRIACYGSGTNPSSSNTTITATGTETSSNWTGSAISSYPSSSTYVNGVMTITKPDSPTTLEGITINIGVNSGVKIFRLQNLTISYTYSTAAEGTVADPTFSPASESSVFYNSTVSIGCETGATVYYTITTDGSTPADPTTASTPYEDPIAITAATTKIKAFAVKDGLENSSIVSATYTLAAPTAPVFSLAEGEVMKGEILTLSTTTGASIHYTTDGSTVPSASVGTLYSEEDGIVINEAQTIKAIAYDPAGNTSDVVTKAYTVFDGTIVTFTAGTDLGTSTSSGNADEISKSGVTISSDNAALGQTEYRLYKDSKTEFSVTKGRITKIIFTQSGSYDISNLTPNTGSLSECVWTGSASSVTFTASAQARASLIQVFVASTAAPTFSVAEGTYDAAQSVELSCATAGATIYYTTDGSTPSSSSTAYSGAIDITETTTLKAIAIKDGVDSDVATATYTMNRPAAPTFDVADCVFDTSFELELSTETEGATIYYTTDGSTPTSASTAYSTKIVIPTEDTTIKAVAIKNGLTSDVATAVYTYDARTTPTFTLSSTTVELKVNDIGEVTLTTNHDGDIETFSSDDGHVTVDFNPETEKYEICVGLAGEYTITFSATGSATYKDASGVVNVTATKKATTMELECVFDNRDLATATMGLIEGTVKYNGDNLEFVPEITYSSSDPAVATVGEDGTVTYVGVGTTTLTASYAGDNEFEPCEATYDLELYDTTPQETEVAITLNNAFFGCAAFTTWTKDMETTLSKTANNITITYEKGSSSNMYCSAEKVRFYTGNTFTIEAPTGYQITKIVMNTTIDSATPAGTITSSTWTGNANSVSLSFANKTDLTSATITLAPEVSVTAAGYATYASRHALDFSESSIQAYIAKFNDDKDGVVFTQVDKVPANTGVLLYKEGGATEVIPVFDGTGAANTDGNVFVPVFVTIDALATDAGGNTNFILNKVGGVIGFYWSAGQKVAAGKAYISVPASSVKSFIALPGFEDETAINEIVNGQSINGKWYNLAGQRVNKAQKGIFIVNGKKVVK